jgi:hypothetical protein
MACQLKLRKHLSLEAYCAATNCHSAQIKYPCLSYKETAVPDWGCDYIFWFNKQLPKDVSLTSQCLAVAGNMLQILQHGSPLNRPIVRRCPLTAARPVRIATAIFSWCLPNLSRSSALFLHGLPIKSLPCLQPGMTFQVTVLP